MLADNIFEQTLPAHIDAFKAHPVGFGSSSPRWRTLPT